MKIKFFKIAMLLFLTAWVSISVERCRVKKTMLDVELKASYTQTQLDSVMSVNAVFSEEKKSLSELVVFWKNKPPRTISNKNGIVVYRDTGRIVETVVEKTIPKFVTVEKYIRDTITKSIGLVLPHYFTILSKDYKLHGRVVADSGVVSDIVEIPNDLALKQTDRYTFSTKTTSIVVANSNPLLGNVTPTFTFRQPTRRRIFVDRLVSFGIGFGSSYLLTKSNILK